MILHLVNDEKFIDMMFEIFERVFPNKNICATLFENENLKYVKKTKLLSIPWKKVLFEDNFLEDFLERNRVSLIFLHYLDNFKLAFSYLAKKVKKDLKVIWIGWGGDYYDLIQIPLYLPESQKLCTALYKTQYKDIPLLKSAKNITVKFLKRSKINLINKSIDFFAPVLYEDYQLLKKNWKNFKPPYKDWNYGILEEHFVPDPSLYVSGENILVGNSSTCTNNHLEAFQLIAKSNLLKRGGKVVVPLGYGDPKYRDIIVKKGRELFGEQFIPIVDFLPLHQYNQILSSCSYAIMNHLRQQAMGNILTVLFMGAKVFFQPKNTAYSFLKKEGVVVYSIEQFQDEIQRKLSREEIEKNRSILKKIWGRETILQKTKNIVSSSLELLQ